MKSSDAQNPTDFRVMGFNYGVYTYKQKQCQQVRGVQSSAWSKKQKRYPRDVL